MSTEALTPDRETLRDALTACLTDFDRFPPLSFVSEWLPRLAAAARQEAADTSGLRERLDEAHALGYREGHRAALAAGATERPLDMIGIWTADSPIGPTMLEYTRPLLATATSAGAHEVTISGVVWTFTPLSPTDTPEAGDA